jgi:hypothetical protein
MGRTVPLGAPRFPRGAAWRGWNWRTPEEQAANDQFTPCCSRSHSPLLVLDL